MLEERALDPGLTVEQRGVRVSAEDLIALVSRILQTEDVPPHHAQLTADILVGADSRGVYSHGVCMLPLYMERLRSRRMVPHPQLRVLAETPATALLDGGNGLGQVVGTWAMQKCIELARKAGMASVAVRRSNHFGMAAHYAM